MEYYGQQYYQAQFNNSWQQEDIDYHQCAHPHSEPSSEIGQILKLVTNIAQKQGDEDRRLEKLQAQMEEIAKYMKQIQEQRELHNSSTANLMEEVEIIDSIDLGREEIEIDPDPFKPNLEVDDFHLLMEEEEDIWMAESLEVAEIDLPKGIVKPETLDYIKDSAVLSGFNIEHDVGLKSNEEMNTTASNYCKEVDELERLLYGEIDVELRMEKPAPNLMHYDINFLDEPN